MTDVLNKEQRSYNMSRIRGKDTLPELLVRRALRKEGIRNYRLYYDLPGKPDLTFPKEKVVVFIDGCFWHKCPLCYREPASRREFWHKKIQRNVERDKVISNILSLQNWKVLRIWEHVVRKDSGFAALEISRELKCSGH